MAGFDAVTNHLSLVLFPVVLDLFLWLGPHWRLAGLLDSFFSQLVPPAGEQTAELTSMLATSRELWLQVAGRFNLLSLLRSFPVGVPSLMLGQAPVVAPAGEPSAWEIPSFGMVLLLGAALTLIGLVVGSLYFHVVAQSVLTGKVDWRQSLRQWPWASSQVVLLALLWLGLFLAISVPFSCLLTVFMFMGGTGISQIGVLLFGGVLIWLLLPLAFSPHGIFVYGQRMWASLKSSLTLTRFTLPATGLFLLVLLVMSEGLDMLWRTPPEDSWFTIVGVAGHAFIATGLLAASFIYYRDTNQWLQRLLWRAKMQ